MENMVTRPTGQCTLHHINLCRSTVYLTQRGQASVTLQPDWLPFNSLGAVVANKRQYKQAKFQTYQYLTYFH